MSLKLNWACCFSMLEPQSVLEKTLALSSVIGALHIPELTFFCIRNCSRIIRGDKIE